MDIVQRWTAEDYPGDEIGPVSFHVTNPSIPCLLPRAIVGSQYPTGGVYNFKLFAPCDFVIPPNVDFVTIQTGVFVYVDEAHARTARSMQVTGTGRILTQDAWIPVVYGREICLNVLPDPAREVFIEVVKDQHIATMYVYSETEVVRR